MCVCVAQVTWTNASWVGFQIGLTVGLGMDLMATQIMLSLVRHDRRVARYNALRG